jgi:hypothetical protein
VIGVTIHAVKQAIKGWRLSGFIRPSHQDFEHLLEHTEYLSAVKVFTLSIFQLVYEN